MKVFILLLDLGKVIRSQDNILLKTVIFNSLLQEHCTKPIVQMLLTHWGRVTHICVGNLTIIGLDNGLSPGRRQAIF